MISVICTLYNRAHLLKWSLKAIQDNFSLPDLHDVEINVLDDHSTDDLDTVLQAFSSVFGVVNKWEWDSKKSLSPRRFNCPAEPYNILVKLAAGEYIYKTDPEMVILDTQFVSKAMAILKDNPSAIVMPFPYHCYEFPFDSIDIIKRDYLKYHYPTHITKDNAKREMVYYQSLFKKEKYLQIGGIEEKFGNGIGYEDNHFLQWWRRDYGEDSFVPLVDSAAVHLFHGGMASGPLGVPEHLYMWVHQNEALGKVLENTRPNDGREWGRIYDNITKTTWREGSLI